MGEVGKWMGKGGGVAPDPHGAQKPEEISSKIYKKRRLTEHI